MMKFEDLQKFNQQGMDVSMRAFGEVSKSWQAIAAEMTDYSKRSFEEGTATFEKLAGAKSWEQAVEIQTNYARRAYEDFVAQCNKMSSMYVDLAKEAFRPVEQAFPTSH